MKTNVSQPICILLSSRERFKPATLFTYLTVVFQNKSLMNAHSFYFRIIDFWGNFKTCIFTSTSDCCISNDMSNKTKRIRTLSIWALLTSKERFKQASLFAYLTVIFRIDNLKEDKTNYLSFHLGITGF